jgi:hypothetical protein
MMMSIASSSRLIALDQVAKIVGMTVQTSLNVIFIVFCHPGTSKGSKMFGLSIDSDRVPVFATKNSASLPLG